MTQPQDALFSEIFILIFIMSFIILFFAAYFKTVIKPFIKKRDYIKMELGRSNEREYRYWKRKLKKLYVQHIPFVGKLIWKLIR